MHTSSLSIPREWAIECLETFRANMIIANMKMIGSKDNQQLHLGSELRMIQT
jgi:hypothetical protein